MTADRLPGFWQAYVVVLLSFVTSRLLNQTDLLFVAKMGADATAAFAVPSRFMVIDAIIAFALGPIISVQVSRAVAGDDRNRIVRGALSLTLTLSIGLVVIGLLIYPWMVEQLVEGERIRELATTGVVWMTVSIPLRMLVFVSTMCLFAGQQGRRVSYIYGVTLLSNAAFDWLLAIYLGLGFEGVYISTFIVSGIELVWLLLLLAGLQGRLPFGAFRTDWLLNLVSKISAEGIRLVSWQAEGLVIVAILASDVAWSAAFSAFGVISEFQALILMPFIALMRTASMQLAQDSNGRTVSSAWNMLNGVRRSVVLVTTVSSLIVALAAWAWGADIYNLDGERLRWWTGYSVVFCIALPIYAHGYMIRACFQASERYADVTRIDVSLTWLLFVPMVWLAIRNQAPMAFAAASVVRELLIILRMRSIAGLSRPVEVK